MPIIFKSRRDPGSRFAYLLLQIENLLFSVISCFGSRIKKLELPLADNCVPLAHLYQIFLGNFGEVIDANHGLKPHLGLGGYAVSLPPRFGLDY